MQFYCQSFVNGLCDLVACILLRGWSFDAFHSLSRLRIVGEFIVLLFLLVVLLLGFCYIPVVVVLSLFKKLLTVVL